MPHTPNEPERDLTDEEGVVLAMTVRHAPCSPEDIKRLIDRDYASSLGALVSLDIPEIEAILARLVDWGLVTSSPLDE